MSRFGVQCCATRALSGIMIKAGLYGEKLRNAIFGGIGRRPIIWAHPATGHFSKPNGMST